MGTQYSSQELVKYGGKVIEIFASQAVVASGNTQSTPINVMPFKEGTFFIRCTAIAGGGAKSLAVTVQSKDPAGAYWLTLTSFTAITAIGGEKKDVSANLGENIAISYALTDITSVTFSVFGVFKIK